MEAAAAAAATAAATSAAAKTLKMTQAPPCHSLCNSHSVCKSGFAQPNCFRSVSLDPCFKPKSSREPVQDMCNTSAWCTNLTAKSGMLQHSATFLHNTETCVFGCRFGMSTSRTPVMLETAMENGGVAALPPCCCCSTTGAFASLQHSMYGGWYRTVDGIPSPHSQYVYPPWLMSRSW